MFTGIVEELGTVLARDGGRFRFSARTVLEDVTEGASIAVNGVLPHRRRLGRRPARRGGRPWRRRSETLARTTLGALRPGDPVNLERPVRLADRLGGHLVQGHVDGVGTVTSPAPDLRVVAARRPRPLHGREGLHHRRRREPHRRRRRAPTSFSVAVIPHTAEVTTLGRRQPGDGVNLEVDVTAKYVERLLTWKA